MTDQDTFQNAMKDAASAAWDKDWPRAVEAYGNAVKASPGDSQALTGLALALFEVGRYPEALQVYQKVSQMVPSDPLPHEKIAQIFERTGRRKEAARKYLEVGELYFNRRDVKRALPNWEQAVSLFIDLPQAHSRLATIYEQDESKKELAVYAYLHLARLLQQIGQAPRAEQSLIKAQNLAPLNADVRNALAALKGDQPLERVDSPDYPPKGKVPVSVDLDLIDEEEQEKEPLKPVEDSARLALSVLADLAWSDEVPENAIGPLTQAIEAHQIGETEKALKLYEEAKKAKLEHPALLFNLGSLYAAQGNAKQAIKTLANVTSEFEYGMAANLATGKVHFADNRFDKAADCLVSALEAGDRMLNAARMDEGGYQRLKEGFKAQTADQHEELAQALTFYLDDAKWRAKLLDTLDGYAARDKFSYVTDLVEMILEGGKPEVAEVMQRIDAFVMRDMLFLAREEAHFAIERAPDYLPVHTRLADILIKEGRRKEAADKINLVAEVYQMRGNQDKATDMFARVIEIWPADMAARNKVIEMLRTQGRVVETLRQYADMGDLYHTMMADTDKALETYDEALTFARTNSAEPQHTLPILKAMADIEQQRLNWQKALGYYERAAELAPSDTDVALAVVNLNFQSGDTVKAISSLDDFLRYCITHGETALVVTTLEDQVRRRPNEIALRQRLADVYYQQKRMTDAIGQLDALGELLLEAGRLEEARAAIKRIIVIDPPDVEGYRQLLSQLES